MKKSTSGFTLIELLVVIAIIGILSSIVIASLNSARTKGADAAVKGQLEQLRASAEIYYDNANQGNGSYGASNTCATGVFASSTTIINQLNANAASTTAAYCSSSADGQKWGVHVNLKSGNRWCVDNSGFNGSGIATAGICA